MKDSMNPMPWKAKPPTITSSALIPSILLEMVPACGPMTRSGYVGKIQTGVISDIVKVCVLHLGLCQHETVKHYLATTYKVK